MTICPVCGGPPHPRERCAICEGTNAHQLRCKRCKADPANADWDEGREDLGREDIASGYLDPAITMGDLLNAPRDEWTELQVRIARLVVHGKVVLEQRWVRGRKRGFREVRIALTTREIAAELGCSHVAVLHVRRVLDGLLAGA